MYPFNDKESLVSGFFIITSPDRVTYQRSIYTFLDFLGDIGGLLDAFKLLGAALINLIYGSSLSNYLLTNLFYDAPSNKGSQIPVHAPD